MRASVSSLSRVSLSYALSLSLSSSCMQRDFGGGVALHSGERARSGGERARRGHDGYHDLGRAESHRAARLARPRGVNRTRRAKSGHSKDRLREESGTQPRGVGGVRDPRSFASPTRSSGEASCPSTSRAVCRTSALAGTRGGGDYVSDVWKDRREGVWDS